MNIIAYVLVIYFVGKVAEAINETGAYLENRKNVC